MKVRLDPKTKVCIEHGVHWCVVCTTDELQDFHYARIERYRARKLAWRETPVNEKFDLGGEA